LKQIGLDKFVDVAIIGNIERTAVFDTGPNSLVKGGCPNHKVSSEAPTPKAYPVRVDLRLSL